MFKKGNQREQIFHAWWSFHFDENTETLDEYVTCIRQVAILLGSGEPQILQLFKNTLPTKLCWVLFPTEDLRQVVETVKRILTTEEIDRRLAGQSSSTPFMSIKDNYNKRVTFDTWDGLEDKIDRLTVMLGQLTTRDNKTNRQCKPKIYQSKRRGQGKKFYDTHSYGRRNYPNRYRSNRGDRRIQFSGPSRGRPRYEQNNRNDFRRGNVGGNERTYQNFGRQNRGGYRGNYRNENYKRERGRSRSRERSFSGNINNRRNDRSIRNSRSRPGSRTSTNRDRIRCYKCREYDHFTKDCPTSKEERERANSANV